MPDEDKKKRPPLKLVTTASDQGTEKPPLKLVTTGSNPSPAEVKKKDLSQQGSSTGSGLFPNTGQTGQVSGTPSKIYSYKEKPDNEYSIINNQWNRRKKGTTQWQPISAASSVNALNARHNKAVPLPLSQTEINFQQGMSTLNEAGIPIGNNLAQPMTGVGGQPVSGQYAPTSGAVLNKPKSIPTFSFDQQNAAGFAQGKKQELDLAKSQELQFAQTPEQIAQVEQRYSALQAEQDLNIEGSELVPQANADVLKPSTSAPLQQMSGGPRKIIPAADRPAMNFQQQTAADRIASVPAPPSDQIQAPESEINNPFNDPESQVKIDQFREVANRDLDEWRKVYGAGLSDEQFNKLKLIQADIKSIAYDLKTPETERAALLEEKQKQIEDFLDESKYVNQKFYKANIEGKSIEDVLYEDKKEKAGQMFETATGREVLGSESLDVEKEIFNAESGLRDFLDHYYGVGQGTFAKDPETGEIKLKGFKSQEDEEYFNKKYKELTGAIKNAKGKRFEMVNNKLVELSNQKRSLESGLRTAEEGDVAEIQGQLRSIDNQISDLKNSKRGMLLTEPKEILKSIAPDVTDSFKRSFSGLPDNLTPKQKFDMGYSQLYDKTMEIKQRIASGNFGYFDEQGANIRDWLDWESIGMDLSPDDREYFKNMRSLNALLPIYSNNDSGIMDENQGFWESFMGSSAKAFGDETSFESDSEREKARLQVSGLAEMGISKDELSDPNAIKDLEKKGKEADLASFEFAGETLGVIAPLIVDLAITKNVSAGALKLLSSEKNVTAVANAYDKAINSTRFGRYLKGPLSEAVNAELAGNLFGQEEELNFQSFLLGGVGSKLIGGALSKIGGEKAAQYISSIFGKNSDRAAQVLTKIGEATSRGVSEVGEESIQELTQIYNDELRDRGFWDEVESRFGTTDDIMKFVVSSFVMGSAFGMMESKSATDQYASMSDEQRATVNAIVQEAGTDLNKAETVASNVVKKLDEIDRVEKKLDAIPEKELPGKVTSESPIVDKSVVDIQSSDSGETEYKVGDKFYSEPEISKMLDDKKFIDDVNSGNISLSVLNPSAEVMEKISPTPKVQDFEIITDPKSTSVNSTKETSKAPEKSVPKEISEDQYTETVTKQQFDDTAGKTDAEVIEQANDIDDGNLEKKKKADAMIQKAIEVLPEGQAAVSNKAIFDGIIEKAKEINQETGLKGKKLIEELSAQIESSFDKKITKDDIADFQKEILAEIPKELKVSGTSIETITKDKFSIVAKAIRDKKFTSSMSDAMSQLRSSPIGIVTGVIDGAMEAVATTIDQAGTVAQAIDNGLKVVKASEWYKNLSDAGKGAAETLFKKNVRKQIDGAVSDKGQKIDQKEQTSASENVESTDNTESYKGPEQQEELSKIEEDQKSEKQEKEPQKRSRGFSEKIMRSDKVGEDIQKGLSDDAKTYLPVSNNVSIEEAEAIIDAKGTDQAFADILNFDNGMEPRARVTLGLKLIDIFNNSESEDDRYKAVQLADELSQYATKLGQGVQAFSIWSRLSVGNIELSYNRDIQKQRSKFKGKNPSLISGAKEGYDAGTGKAAKKAVGSVFGKNTKQAKKAKAFGLDKDQIEQRKKEALEKVRKSMKGGPLTSGGINVELLEALGEYGFALFADGVRSFKEWSSRMRSETGIEDEDVLRSIWMDSSNSSIGKSLNDLSQISSIEEVVSEFFTKDTSAKKLVEKLQDVFGIDEDTAIGLAGEISEEFEKIVKQERKSEIQKRTPRLTKKAQKAIDELSGEEYLTKEQIEDKILDAFGLGKMSVETAAALRDLAKERDLRPEGSLRDEVTREILSLVAKEQGIKAGDIFWSVWYANVLSGIETQVLNIASNAMNIAMEGLVTSIDSALLKGDPKAIAGSISGLVDGMKKGWREFEDVLSKGYSPERLRSKMEVKDTLENVDFWGGKWNPATYYKYVGRFMSAVDTGAYLAAKGSRQQQIAHEIAKSEGLSGEALRKKVSDVLNDSDQAYNDALERATREVEEIDSRSITKMSERAKSRTIKARADEIVSSKIDDEVVEEARKFASFVTYNYDPQGVLGWAASGLSKAGEKFKPFKLVVPFTRIVANVLNQQIDYTPYGYMRAFGINVSHWSGGIGSTEAKDSRDRRRQLIKATMGTFLMVGVYMLAAAYGDDEDPWFDITGKGPSDFNKKSQLMSTGWKPYHIKVGGVWMNYQYTPFGFALSYVGNWRDNEKYKELAQKDWMTKSAYAFQSSASGVMDMSFLTGLSGLMSGLSSTSNPENIQDRLIKAGASTATSFVPNLFKQADKLYDPTVYDAKTLPAVLMKDMPILRRYSGLKPKLNAFGQPVEKMGNRFFTVEGSDPVWKFMAKHRVFAPGVSQNTKLPDGTVMSDDQMYDYVKESGTIAYENIKDNQGYYESIFAMMDAEQKKKMIQRLFRTARKAAKGIVYLKTLN